MSYIHLLFPPGESILQDYTGHGEGLSPQVFKFDASRVRWGNPESLTKMCRDVDHRTSLGDNSDPSTHRKMRIVYSKTRSPVLKEHRFYMIKRKCRNCGRPSRRYNCGHVHLISPRHWIDTQPEVSTPDSEGESTQSPSSVESNSSYAASPVDSYVSSSTYDLESVCDQFRSGPFDHIFDGLRLTDQERELIEELAHSESQVQERRAPTAEEIVQTISQTTYTDFVSYNFTCAADAVRPADTNQKESEMKLIRRDGGIQKVEETTPQDRRIPDTDDVSAKGERCGLAGA